MRTDAQKTIGLQKMRAFTNTGADYLICVYLFLMLAVFPLYSQEGYAHIGTDKAYFFCRVSLCAGAILAVLLVIRGAAEGAAILKGISIHRKELSAEKGRTRRREKAREPERELEKIFSSADSFALLYGGAVLLSYVCSDYQENAFWGARGWYMGLVPQLTLVMIYFLVSRLWKPRSRMFLLMLAASAAVFLLGCLNRFDLYPIKMAYSSPEYISTIGNINWFCGYAVTTAFFGVALLWLRQDWKPLQKVILMLHAAAGFTALVLQGSESGLAALGVILLALFWKSAEDERRMSAFWQEVLLLGGCCLLIFAVRLLAPGRMNYVDGLGDLLTRGWLSAIIVIMSGVMLWLTERSRRRGSYPKKGFRIAAVLVVCGCIVTVVSVIILAAVNTAHPGSIGVLSKYSLFTFDEEWGSSRGVTWLAGWKCFAEQDFLHKLTGVGPDCMAEYLYNDAGSGLQVMVRERFGYARLTNAHNEWLTVLVNTGLLGAISFAGMIVSGIKRLLQGGRKNPLAAACGFSLLGYTINNIFSFQQAISAGTVFVIFGMGIAFLRAEETEESDNR
ncbi:MAG: O-antigen ligase family protein [Roseburia sp.]|nr:O-antigen ligase family protein [Roseburia sp.]MCM1098135.1 O-antigen ligase family protein [Ruminococcus flavefaciens]